MKGLSDLQLSLHKTVHRIQSTLDLDDQSYSEYLRLSETTLKKIKRGRTTYSIENIHSLCSRLDLSFDRVLQGEIDFPSLEKQFHGNISTLPERYLNPQHQLGKARAIIGLFDYLDIYYGEDYTRSIRRWLQFRSTALTDPLTPVSPLILIDALKKLEEDGIKDKRVLLTGTHNLIINGNTLFGRILSKKPNPSELYRSIHEELLGYYDQLFDYRLLRLSPNDCLIEVKMKDQTKDLFSTHVLGGRSVCLYKQGVYISCVGNIQEPLAKIKESECMYKGAPRCVYQLSW